MAPRARSGSGDGAARAAAFFDLDRTLMAGSSGLPYARAAHRAGWLSSKTMLRWGMDHLRFRLRGANEEATARILAEAREVLTGVELKEVTRMTPDVLVAILPRIYPEMLAEVHSHQDAGRATVIVSAAGAGIVETLARVLDMDAGIGTPYAVGEDGRFNGELDGPFMYGTGKEEAIQRFAEENGVDLAASWAYSDSVSDLPMLRAVGNPVAVNPDEELARIARDEGWRVMRFERLGRRLALTAAALTAVAVGGVRAARGARGAPSRLATLRR
jgi:HAD superfamily hydrolase (TIGR01490 family)